MSLRRPDWLGELQTLLLLALIISALAVGVGLVTSGFDDTVTFTVPAGSVDGITEVRGPLRDNAAVDPDGSVDIRVTDPSTRQRVLNVLTGLPSYALGLTMLVLLWSTVRMARRVDPFSPAVARRLTVLGFVVIGGGPLADVIQLAATFLGSETVFDGILSASYVASWWWILTGFGFLAMAEIVKRGAAMRAELDQVI